jgi:SAM-dependent methyltransferase
VSTHGKYDTAAAHWTETAYADAATYLARRGDLVIGLGPRLEPGDVVLDLACGDAGAAELLLSRGLRYVGVDASEAMATAARRRLAGRGMAFTGDLNEFRSEEPVAATTCFRAIYYAQNRRAFFRRVGDYTEKKLVFDLNPRQYSLDEVRADLRAAGFDALALRPFFCPQRLALPAPLHLALQAAERIPPLAAVALRFRFSYMCAASRAGA